MTEISEVKFRGVASSWPKRSALIKALRKANVRSIHPLIEYNDRTDLDNPVQLVPSVEYSGLGRDMEFEAIAVALEGGAWVSALARPIAYRLFSNKLNYFWHENFRLLYRESGRVLNMFDTNLAIVDMGFAFLLGWYEEALLMGYIVHAALNRKHYFLLQYENEHRRGQAFMARLFADWRGDVAHKWPEYAYDEPVYNGLLERWRDPDPETLVPWLVAACELHTHQTGRESSTIFYDFSDYTLARTPVEILMLFRLRQINGLKNPQLNHPLLVSPFDQLPDAQQLYPSDDLMDGTLRRVRQDWPNFDKIISLDSVKSNK